MFKKLNSFKNAVCLPARGQPFGDTAKPAVATRLLRNGDSRAESKETSPYGQAVRSLRVSDAGEGKPRGAVVRAWHGGTALRWPRPLRGPRPLHGSPKSAVPGAAAPRGPRPRPLPVSELCRRQALAPTQSACWRFIMQIAKPARFLHLSSWLEGSFLSSAEYCSVVWRGHHRLFSHRRAARWS